MPLLAIEDSDLFIEDELAEEDELQDLLMQLRRAPLDINSASREDLALLPWLEPSDIDRIIRFRKENLIENISDLSAAGLSDITIAQIKPYISFTTPRTYNLFHISRLELHERHYHLPSTLNHYQRWIISDPQYKFGFISDKDQGERDMFDFISYFLEYQSDTTIRQVILGKYRLVLGQGILYAPKLGMSKSANATTTPIKSHSNVRPYTSSYEIWALEGATAVLHYNNFEIVPFYSSTKLSANLSEGAITSFNESGIHHDPEAKHNVKENISGLAVSYRYDDHYIGSSFSGLAFDKPFADPKRAQKYDAFNLYFNLFGSKTPIFGEFAYADSKNALIMGFRHGDTRFRQLILARYYEKNFPTWHGNPFSSQTRFDNEQGFYYGLTFTPTSSIRVNAYLDVWNHPGTRYFEKMPTAAHEEFIQLRFRHQKHIVQVSYSHKNRERQIRIDDVSKIRQQRRSVYRFDWWQHYSSIMLKSRLEMVEEYLPEEEHYSRGFLAFQQLRLPLEKLELLLQLTVYHSDVLLYMYEHSLDGKMQNSIFRGDGIHCNLVVKYTFSEHWEFQAKVSDGWFSRDDFSVMCQLIVSF